MTESAASLRHKIVGAGELQSVVRSMKALAASNIVEYEKSVTALAEYFRVVEMGLGVCVRNNGASGIFIERDNTKPDSGEIGAVVFGSDQGLAGQFNEVIANFAAKALTALPGRARVWAVGERVHACLAAAGLNVIGLFAVPNSVKAITPLVGEIQIVSEVRRINSADVSLYVFHNRPTAGSLYEPVSQRLLPFDATWQQDLAAIPWPTTMLPEVLCPGDAAFSALIRELLFVSLYKACAGSLASENASRLAAMGRAELNINNLLEQLNGTLHRVRQGGIDDELFDVISGSEALILPKSA